MAEPSSSERGVNAQPPPAAKRYIVSHDDDNWIVTAAAPLTKKDLIHDKVTMFMCVSHKYDIFTWKRDGGRWISDVRWEIARAVLDECSFTCDGPCPFGLSESEALDFLNLSLGAGVLTVRDPQKVGRPEAKLHLG